MIHSPAKGLDDSLHLQCEEEGSEARNVDIRLYGDEIHLQVVGLGGTSTMSCSSGDNSGKRLRSMPCCLARIRVASSCQRMSFTKSRHW